MNIQLNRRHTYWATSPNVHFYKKIEGSGYYIEYSPNIKMYRINHKKGVPLELMGYTPHLKALELQADKYVRKHK